MIVISVRCRYVCFSSTADSAVPSEPQIRLIPRDYMEGKKLEIVCSSEGSPTPNVTLMIGSASEKPVRAKAD